MVAMAALFQASTALVATQRHTLSPEGCSLKSHFQCRNVSSFAGTSLPRLWRQKRKPFGTKRHSSGGEARAAEAAKVAVAVEQSCQVGDHALDNVSNFIFHQIQRPFVKFLPDGWDPLKSLPVNIQSSLQKTEALATLVVREILVLAAVYLVYQKVDMFCRLLYRVLTRKQSKGEPIDEAIYEESPYQAAQQPLRSLLLIWASTRLLWETSVLWKMQAVVSPVIIYKIRAVSVISTICWFFFRWKQLYVDELIRQKPEETSRVFAIDKILSLAMYALAASCIAEVLGLALGSLLAVGGVSGLAVGLAAKEVVGNMFGGASLFITRPFVIGEKIKAGDISGHVQDIGFLQTRVQGFDGVPVLVPNQTFTSKVITNFSRAKSKVLEASFQLNNRHMFLVHDITTGVQKYLGSHEGVETVKATPICYLKSMEKDGPQIALSCVIKTIGGAAFYKYQQEILIHVAQIITDILGSDSPFTPLKSPTSV